MTVSAQAKGGGMIQPNMATMLCFVQTDAVVEDPDAALRAATDASFERITVDGQMSTNDTVLLQATGSSGAPLPEGLLEAVLLQLALEVVADGEGSSRVGRVQVDGAASQAEAERVARAIANSPLVKTALFGRDPNWGRIAQAAGMALAGEDLEEIGGREHRQRRACRGRPRGRDRPAARPRRAQRPRLVLRPRLRVRADQRGVHDMSYANARGGR